MRPSDLGILTALLISLLVHALMVPLILWLDRGDPRPEFLDSHRHSARILSMENAGSSNLPNPLLMPEPESTLGEASGTGTAFRSSVGFDDPMLACQGNEDQPWLSRNPAGAGRTGDEPSKSTAPPGQNGAGGIAPAQLMRVVEKMDDAKANNTPFGPPAAELVPRVRPRAAAMTPPPSAPPRTVAISPTTPPPPLDNPDLQPIALGPAKVPSPPATMPATRPAVVVAMAAVAPAVAPRPPIEPASKTGDSHASDPDKNSAPPGRPGPPIAAADPAPESDAESDAFSRTGSVIFRAGKVLARCGRKVKTVRPHLDVKGVVNASTMDNPTVYMKIRVSEEGKVMDVAIVRSSGSNEIDVPVKNAVYLWQFDPVYGANGKPMRTVERLSITIYN